MAARSCLNREAIERYEARSLADEQRPRRSPPARAAAPTARVRRRVPQRVAITVRVRRVVVLAAIVLLVDLLCSFALAMMQPSNVPFGVRAVEWFRDNGAAWR